MDNRINNEATIVSLSKMIYRVIYEMQYRLSKRPDEKRIFSFLKEFLDGNEITESTFWERLRTLDIDGEVVNKPSKKENSFFLAKSNYMPVLVLTMYPTINSLAAPLHALKI